MTVGSTISDNKRFCKCGCDELIDATDKRGRERFYINGHCNTGWFKNGHNNSKLEKNSMWNGGTTYNTKGYILLKNPNHPRANNHGYVLEHILVMEKKLGRYISNDEAVHHLNGIKTDNRPENLEVILYGEHSQFHNVLRRIIRDEINQTINIHP